MAAKAVKQWMLDHYRKTYRIESFPMELDEAEIAGWVHSITGTLRPRLFSFGTSPTVVFEVWGDKNGIVHRIKVPLGDDEHIIGQLRGHVPGLRVIEESDFPKHSWKRAVEVGMTNKSRTLGIHSPEAMSTTMLASFRHLKNDERLLVQWVVTPALTNEVPQYNNTKTNQFRWESVVKGTLDANRDEVNDRRKKLEEPNLLAVLRVAADANTDTRAEHIIENVRKAIWSARGSKSYFNRRFVFQDSLKRRISEAASPFTFPIQLSVSELVALLGWPVGKSIRPGVSVSMSRHLPPAAIIPSSGRVLGTANLAGSQRDIAMSYASAVRHIHCVGRIGVGKTTLLTNMIAQDMEQGFGVIVIESKDDLFKHVLQRIPTSRLDDVIILDVNDANYPVGFNLFDQGNSRTAIDELCALVDSMYKESSQSITAPKMLYHLTHALAEVPDTTFMDLPTLMTPSAATTPDGIWRDNIARQVKDAQVKDYLQAFFNMKPAEQDRLAAPLYNRIWEFTSRPEMRAILGQRTSSFKMRDVIKSNQILLVNLSGARVGVKTANLAGTFLVNSIWQAVRSLTPDKPNFLYLDEFADFMNFPIDIESILAKSRSARLGMILAHQNLAQISPQLREGVMANTATKIAFRTSARDAGLLAREFGRSVDEDDFVGLPQHEAIALVATDTGNAPPVTISTKQPGKSTGNAGKARYMSQSKYGRPMEDVERNLHERKVLNQQKRNKPPRSGADWGR